MPDELSVFVGTIFLFKVWIEFYLQSCSQTWPKRWEIFQNNALCPCPVSMVTTVSIFSLGVRCLFSVLVFCKLISFFLLIHLTQFVSFLSVTFKSIIMTLVFICVMCVYKCARIG